MTGFTTILFFLALYNENLYEERRLTKLFQQE